MADIEDGSILRMAAIRMEWLLWRMADGCY